MPPQNHADLPQPPVSLSRRSLLRGAAGVGAVSVAAAAGAGTIFAAAPSANAATGAHDDSAHDNSALENSAAHDEPVVAYLRDAATGEFEVFHGTRQVRVRDKKLAVQLLNQVR